MENDKYYTPSIEEFHVGFEFKICNTYNSLNPENQWKIQIYDGTYSLLELKKYLPIDCIRVKYLDKEDIESLIGECKILSEQNNSLISCLLEGNSNREGKKTKFQLYYNPKSKWLLISERLGTRFAGFIKNKSELKVLLKQLNIQ